MSHDFVRLLSTTQARALKACEPLSDQLIPFFFCRWEVTKLLDRSTGLLELRSPSLARSA